MSDLRPDSAETVRLLETAATGDITAISQLFDRHRPSLEEFVSLRLDRRLRTRLDPSDVIQETQLEALRRFDDFLRRRPMPFRLWLRKTAYERLLMLRRRHLKAGKRQVQRELPLPERSSLALALKLFAPGPSPAQKAAARDLARRVREAISRLPDADREILLLHTFEGLSYEESAVLLEVKPETAKKRHGRALLRLHKLLVAEGLDENAVVQ